MIKNETDEYDDDDEYYKWNNFRFSTFAMINVIRITMMEDDYDDDHHCDHDDVLVMMIFH